jgi:hypothetical protein
MSVFDRLGYNFNSDLFGTAIDFTDGQKVYYTGQTILKQWQIDDLAANTVYGYFQNPLANNLSDLTIVTTGIKLVANSISGEYRVSDPTLSAAANTLMLYTDTLLSEITSFTTHTNNLSNVTQSTNKLTTPDYQGGLAIGRQVLTIVNQTDKLQNNAPVLGNFTSLTMANTISSNVVTLTSDLASMNVLPTPASLNTITQHVAGSYSVLSQRRTADISFYQKSVALVRDFNTVSQFDALGAVSSYLINDLPIGTPKLVNNLQS